MEVLAFIGGLVLLLILLLAILMVAGIVTVTCSHNLDE